MPASAACCDRFAHARIRRAAPRACRVSSVDLSMPLPMVALPCGSMSTSSTRAARRRQRRGKVDGGRGLADPALLIGDCDDPLHERQSNGWTCGATGKLVRMWRVLSGIVVVAVFAMITYALWARLNRPEHEPEWPRRIQGVAYSPYQAGQTPWSGEPPTDAQIDADLALFRDKAHAIRTYSVLNTQADIPALAAKHDLSVALGAWMGTDHERNEYELKKVIELARDNRNVVRVFVGNEVLLRGELPVDELIAYIERARKAIRQPVGTAETWNTWLQNPKLAEHVDFIAVHLLPYWEGVERRRRGRVLRCGAEARAAGLSRQARDHRRGGLAFGRAHARQRQRQPGRRGAVPAALPQRRRKGGLPLLRDGSVRPALEGARRGRRRCVLGNLRRQPPAEIRIRCADRAHPGVAPAGDHIDGARRPDPRAVLRAQRSAAHLGTHAARRGRVRGRDDLRVDRLRLHAAVPDADDRHRRHAADPRHARRHRRAVRRGARVGRGALDPRASAPARPAAHGDRVTCRRCRCTCRPATSRRRW